jgi:hypothetical protein
MIAENDSVVGRSASGRMTRNRLPSGITAY